MTFETIETQRLILSPLTYSKGNIDGLVEGLNNDTEISNYITCPNPYTVNDAKFWLKQKKPGIEWGIYEKTNQDKPIGTVMLKNNGYLSWWLSKTFRNRGYMSECVSAVIDYAKNKTSLSILSWQALYTNINSAQLAMKNNFSFIGVFDLIDQNNKEVMNCAYYGQTRFYKISRKISVAKLNLKSDNLQTNNWPLFYQYSHLFKKEIINIFSGVTYSSNVKDVQNTLIEIMKHETNLTKIEIDIFSEISKSNNGETINNSSLTSKFGITNTSLKKLNICAKNPFPLIIPCHRLRQNNSKEFCLGNESRKHLLYLEKKTK